MDGINGTVKSPDTTVQIVIAIDCHCHYTVYVFITIVVDLWTMLFLVPVYVM